MARIAKELLEQGESWPQEFRDRIAEHARYKEICIEGNLDEHLVGCNSAAGGGCCL